jgi:hypothetical protein
MSDIFPFNSLRYIERPSWANILAAGYRSTLSRALN